MGHFQRGKILKKNSIDIHENSFGFCSLIIPVNFTRDYPCLLSAYLLPVLLSHAFFTSVLFVRCTFCSFCYLMSFSLQFSSFVVPFARSAIPCLFLFSSPRSLHLLPVLPSLVFSSSVLFVRRTFCPFCYPMSFSLQFSSFVKNAQHVSCDWRFFNCSAFAKDLAGCFSHCCDESVNWCIHFYVIYIERGGRC